MSRLAIIAAAFALAIPQAARAETPAPLESAGFKSAIENACHGDVVCQRFFIKKNNEFGRMLDEIKKMTALNDYQKLLVMEAIGKALDKE
jgi:hypothetical protein